MKSAVVVFPASNCDRDVAVAIEQITGSRPAMVWHADAALPEGLDLIVLPGGFSFGDYLRCGAIAARSPIMRDVVARARAGTPTLGICNGFQILCEAGLLPGVLMRNASLHFICRDVHVRVERTTTPFTNRYSPGAVLRIPIAHADGNYFTDPEMLARIEGEGQVALRYVTPSGEASAEANPNGSLANIAGLCSPDGRILGLMPHPERLADVELGGTDGRAMFESVLACVAEAA
ncbi:MAG: phosphoribosylformylglycinamidine synthase subunit PurQ [Rhizobiales bacterium]|nr:phosphoribosylformylglycinamidine synthase subunit PurQ [Hyphomicrobiales bacterium]